MSASPPRRVLVIEDHADGRESMRLLLSIAGYEVEVAAFGMEGVRKALASPPDVALIDVGLPDLDGIAVGRWLREALGPEVILVAYTADDDQVTVRHLARAGFDAHLIKPVDFEELSRCLEGQVRAPFSARAAAHRLQKV